MRFGVPLFRPHVLQPRGDPLHVLAAGDVFDVRKKSVSTQTNTSLAVVLLHVLVITVCGEAIFQYSKVNLPLIKPKVIKFSKLCF